MVSSMFYVLAIPIFVKANTRSLLTGISFAWILSFLLAFIPLVLSFNFLYADQAIVENNPYFRNATVDFSSVKTWIEKLFSFDRDFTDFPDNPVKDVKQAKFWEQFQTFVKNRNDFESLQIS